MRAADPRAAARALAFGRVKVCGLTDAHDVETAAAVGAAYAGLVMVPHTPRAVTTGQAERLAATAAQIGRASWRERVGQYVELSGDAGSVQKKKLCFNK